MKYDSVSVMTSMMQIIFLGGWSVIFVFSVYSTYAYFDLPIHSSNPL